MVKPENRKENQKRSPGRPSKLAAAKRKKLVDSLSVGAHRAQAATSAGIAPSTFYSWMERGQADREHGVDSEYSRLVEEVEVADADAEVGFLQVIKKASEKEWRAAAWWLSRAAPARWGDKPRTDDEPWTEQVSAQLARLETELDAATKDTA